MDTNRKRELEVKERNKALTDLDAKELDLLRQLEDVIAQQNSAAIEKQAEAAQAAVEGEVQSAEEANDEVAEEPKEEQKDEEQSEEEKAEEK